MSAFWRKFVFAWLCQLAVAGCSGSDDLATGKSGDAGSDAASDAPPDAVGCSSPNAVGSAAATAEWCEVDRVLDESLASSGIGTSAYPGFAFQVYEFDDAKGEPVLRYSRADGTIAASTADVTLPVATASAAKMIAALLIARATNFAKTAGDSSLSPATGIDVLGCTGVSAGLAGTTLSDLMHQISGLTPAKENPCVQSLTTPLAECACSILQDDYVAAVDGTFAYTPHNFTVAVAMADAVLKKLSPPSDVRSLFDKFVSDLGLPSSEASLAPSNNFAGGDRLSARAYGTLLSLALPGTSRGSFHQQTLLDAEILDQMTTPFGDNVEITYSPYIEAANFSMRYGFGDWVQCSDAWPEPASWPALDKPVITLDYASCPYRVVSSLGKFGYMPWFPTRESRPYAAVLAVNLSGNGPLVSANSFAAYQMLDPVVRVAVDATPK